MIRSVAFMFVISSALAACGGPETSQANNVQANLSNTASPAATAPPSTVTADAFSEISGEQAKSVMHERHEGMEAIGKANKSIKRELEGSAPDLVTVRTAATKIADLSQKASGWFHAGTGPDVGKTGAKPEIWRNTQDFAAKLAAFQKATAAFNSTASGSDVNAIKASFGELGQACKACHDKYRSEMHH
jgi:cytochrome c556